MSDRDFQMEVLDRLAELKAEQAETRTEVKNIVARLDTLNGKVLKHEVELAERRGAEKAESRWTDHLIPVMRYAVGITLAVVAVLVLNHAQLFTVFK